MIILVTGVPGSGKTAKVVDLLAHDPQFTGRPLFVTGIPDLAIDHQQCPPVADWVEFRDNETGDLSLPYFTFPANSVVVVDEAQRVYRPRPNGSKVPPEVQAFETHRHTGVDFILITQHPNLLDANIRKLVGRHLHVHVTSLGRQLLDWPRCGDVDARTERDLASRSSYKPPSRVFQLYKSAEAHTVIKRKKPWYFFVALGSIPLLVFAGYFVAQRLMNPGGSAGVIGSAAVPAEKQVTSYGRPKKTESKTASEYMAESIPRITGLWHTAPRYDSVTEPTSAPFPVGCLISGTTCRCVDQQGNRYVTPHALCVSIVHNGIFRDFELTKSNDMKPKKDG